MFARLVECISGVRAVGLVSGRAAATARRQDSNHSLHERTAAHVITTHCCSCCFPLPSVVSAVVPSASAPPPFAAAAQLSSAALCISRSPHSHSLHSHLTAASSPQWATASALTRLTQSQPPLRMSSIVPLPPPLCRSRKATPAAHSTPAAVVLCSPTQNSQRHNRQ